MIRHVEVRPAIAWVYRPGMFERFAATYHGVRPFLAAWRMPVGAERLRHVRPFPAPKP